MKPIKITADSRLPENNDFTVINLENKNAIWLAVNKFVLHIKQNEFSIDVNVYGLNAVLEDEVASLTAWDEDIPEETDDG